MRTYTQKQKPGKQPEPANFAAPRRPLPDQSHEAHPILHLQRAIGNQRVQQLLRANAHVIEASSSPTTSINFAPASVQSKLAVNTPQDRREMETARIVEPSPRLSQMERACACGGTCSQCSVKPDGQRQFPAPAAQLQTSGYSIGQAVAEGGAIQRQNGPSSQPVSQPSSQPAFNSFFFCNPPLPDSTQIRRAVDTAKLWVRLVIPTLELFKMGRLTEPQRTVVRLALRDNFNLTDPTPRLTLLPEPPIETILRNFITIEQALNQSMMFFCTTSACLIGDIAWVIRDPERFGLPKGIITICPQFDGCDPLTQASTIIHERAHESIRAEDHFYETNSAYDSMATITALENADSYAVAARQIANNGTYGPGLSCSLLTSRLPRLQLMEPTLQLPKAPEPGFHLPGLTFQPPEP
jgi:hypothetical protein